jgi:hypothetical protein
MKMGVQASLAQTSELSVFKKCWRQKASIRMFAARGVVTFMQLAAKTSPNLVQIAR